MKVHSTPIQLLCALHHC